MWELPSKERSISQGGNKLTMARFGKSLSSIALLAAMALPLAAQPRDDHDHDHDHDRDHRYYDRSHHDYHRWNDHEDQAYRRWMADRHHNYVEYGKLSAADRDRYWRWRHDHPDA